MDKNKSLGIIFISLIGFCLSFFLLNYSINDNHLLHDTDFNYPVESYKLFFNKNPQFLLWIFIISILISISSGLIFPVIFKVREIVKTFNVKYLTIYFNVFLSMVIMGVVIFVLQSSQYLTGGSQIMAFHDILLNKPEIVMNLIVLFSLLIPFIGIIGMLIINHSAGMINFHNVKSERKKLINQYGLLSKTLDYFLTLNGLIITGGIIATGKQRLSIIEVIGKDQGLVYPIEFVYIYGAFFTVLLAIIYIPIFNHVQITGKKLKEIVSESAKNESIEKVQKDKLGNMINTEQTVFEKLKVSLSIFAPILGSVLIKLLEF